MELPIGSILSNQMKSDFSSGSNQQEDTNIHNRGRRNAVSNVELTFDPLVAHQSHKDLFAVEESWDIELEPEKPFRHPSDAFSLSCNNALAEPVRSQPNHVPESNSAMLPNIDTNLSQNLVETHEHSIGALAQPSKKHLFVVDIDAEIENLKLKNAVLQEQSDRIPSLEEDLKKREAQVIFFIREAHDLRLTIARLEETVTQQGGQIDTLASKNSPESSLEVLLGSKISALKTELSKVTMDMAEQSENSKSVIRDLKYTVGQLQDDKIAFDEAIYTLEKENAALRLTSTEGIRLQENINELKSCNSSLKVENETLKGTLSIMERSVSEIREQKESASAHARENCSLLATARLEVSELDHECERMDTELTELRADIRKKTGQIICLINEVCILNTTIEKQDSEGVHFQEQIVELEKLLNIAEENLASSVDENASLSSRLDEAHMDSIKYCNSIETRDLEILRLSEEAQLSEYELGDLQLLIESQNCMITELEAVADLSKFSTEQVNLLIDAVADRELQLEDALNMAVNASSPETPIVASLEDSLKKANVEIDNLLVSKRDLQDKNEWVQAVLRQRDLHIASLELQLQSGNRDGLLEETLVALEESNAHVVLLNDEIAQLKATVSSKSSIVAELSRSTEVFKKAASKSALYEAQLVELEQQVASRDLKKEEYSSSIVSLRDIEQELLDLREIIASSSVEIATLTADKCALAVELASKVKKHGEELPEISLGNTTSLVSDMHKQIALKEAVIKQLHNSNDHLNEQLSPQSMAALLDTKAMVISELTLSKACLSENLTSELQKTNEYLTLESEFKDKIRVMSLELSANNKRIDELEVSKASLGLKISQLAKDIANQNEQISLLQKKLQNNENDSLLQAAKRDIYSRDLEIASLKRSLDELTKPHPVDCLPVESIVVAKVSHPDETAAQLISKIETLEVESRKTHASLELEFTAQRTTLRNRIKNLEGERAELLFNAQNSSDVSDLEIRLLEDTKPHSDFLRDLSIGFDSILGDAGTSLNETCDYHTEALSKLEKVQNYLTCLSGDIDHKTRQIHKLEEQMNSRETSKELYEESCIQVEQLKTQLNEMMESKLEDESKITQLRSELKELGLFSAQARPALEDMRALIAELSTLLTTRDTELRERDTLLLEYQFEIESLDSRYADIMSEHDMLLRDYEILQLESAKQLDASTSLYAALKCSEDAFVELQQSVDLLSEYSSDDSSKNETTDGTRELEGRLLEAYQELEKLRAQLKTSESLKTFLENSDELNSTIMSLSTNRASLESTVEELKEQLARKEDSLLAVIFDSETLKNSIAEFMAHIEELEGERDMLMGVLSDRDEKITELRSQLQSVSALENGYKKLKSSVKDRDLEISSLSDENSSLKAEISMLSKYFTRPSSEDSENVTVQQLEFNLEILMKENKFNTEEIARLVNELSNHSYRDDEVEKIRTELHDKECRLEQVLAEIDTLTSKLSSATSEVSTMTSRLKRKDCELASTSNALKRLQEEFGELDVSGLKLSLDRKARHLKALKQENCALIKEVDDLQGSLQSLKSSKTGLNERSQIASELEGRLSELESCISERNAALESIAHENISLRSETEAFKFRIGDMLHRVQSRTSSPTSLQSLEIGELRRIWDVESSIYINENNRLQELIQRLEVELNAEREGLDEERETVHDEINTRDDIIASLRLENEELQMELVSANARHSVISSRLDELSASREKLQVLLLEQQQLSRDESTTKTLLAERDHEIDELLGKVAQLEATKDQIEREMRADLSALAAENETLKNFETENPHLSVDTRTLKNCNRVLRERLEKLEKVCSTYEKGLRMIASCYQKCIAKDNRTEEDFKPLFNLLGNLQ